jgi:hypothetical protein
VAIAILQNDLAMAQLGFQPASWDRQKEATERAFYLYNGQHAANHQLELFQ